MELSLLQNKLNGYKKGTFVKVVWEKEISSAKAKKSNVKVMKRCEGIVRAGVTYANIGLVKEILANKAQNEITDSRPSWFEHIGNGIVQHKTNTEKKYLQLFFVNNKKIKSKISVEGVDTTNANELYELGLITKADLPKQNDEPLVTMTISVENIVSFGK